MPTLTPFGKEVVEKDNANSTLRIIFNIVWLVLFGWEIALAHLLSAVVLFITIIGIPFGKQHIKLIPLGPLPLRAGTAVGGDRDSQSRPKNKPAQPTVAHFLFAPQTATKSKTRITFPYIWRITLLMAKN